jgi:hypothetical protein
MTTTTLHEGRIHVGPIVASLVTRSSRSRRAQHLRRIWRTSGHSARSTIYYCDAANQCIERIHISAVGEWFVYSVQGVQKRSSWHLCFDKIMCFEVLFRTYMYYGFNTRLVTVALNKCDFYREHCVMDYSNVCVSNSYGLSCKMFLKTYSSQNSHIAWLSEGRPCGKCYILQFVAWNYVEYFARY